jgi:predicted DNA-binding transcriptional regulator AlpA
MNVTKPSSVGRADSQPPRDARAHSSPASKTTLTVTDVQRFLGKSKRAFYVLRCDPAEEFPAPFVINGRDHWLMRDLLDWIQSRRRRDAVPGRLARAYPEHNRNP